jgi:hypothetical protein
MWDKADRAIDGQNNGSMSAIGYVPANFVVSWG